MGIWRGRDLQVELKNHPGTVTQEKLELLVNPNTDDEHGNLPANASFTMLPYFHVRAPRFMNSMPLSSWCFMLNALISNAVHREFQLELQPPDLKRSPMCECRWEQTPTRATMCLQRLLTM